ncbi:MAG: leucine-rich repeat protein, partial [Prevotella sp.]|nr:leucine-rich repeat protein [Prevotella sp.]
AYDVTEIPAKAFIGQTGITDVLFTKDNALSSDGGYAVTTIGASAFEGTTGLTGTVQIPRTVTSIGNNAFALTSSSPSTLSDVVVDKSTESSAALSFGSDVFLGRKITNLHIMGNIGQYVTVTDDKAVVFTKDNVENVLYYSDGTDDDYYAFLTSISSKNFGLPGKNLYLPSKNIKSFVSQCKENNHSEWLPKTVNCLTFDHTSADGSVYTFMLASNSTSLGGPQVALHAVKNLQKPDLTLNFNDGEWQLDLMPVATGITADISIIDSRAFAGNDNLRSITIIPNTSDDAISLMGNAFAGAKGLRYVDLSGNEKFSLASGCSLSRIATTTDDESLPYKYTNGTYEYEKDGKTPFGGLPAYTLVFLRQNVKNYPSGSEEKETVYKVDGITPTGYKRNADENFVLLNADGNTYSCSHFGVYEVPELDASTVSGQKYTWYTFLNAHDFTAANSTYYRKYAANVPGSVCLPFAPDATTSGVFRSYKSNDASHVTLQPVASPKAATPYFFYPSEDVMLTSATQQTVKAVTGSEALSDENMYGTYAGMSLQSESGSAAYGMASSDFTYNGKSYPAGTFVKFSSTAWLNPFRAYLLLSGSGAKAAVMETELDDTPTGITTVGMSKADNTPYYNMQGMKVSRPGKGLYIHNGKKVWLK